MKAPSPTDTLRAQRLAAHGLSRPATTVAAAARRALGLQAQDLRQAAWALGVRTAGATRASVDAAFAAREVVRTWSLRGTLHVTPAEDLPWLVRLLAPKNLARARGRLRQLAIADEDVAAARAVVERSLAGVSLSRDELFARLEAAGQAVRDQRGVHLLFCLSQAGVIAQAGEPFVLVEDVVRRPRALTGDEALGELARRYLEGHGPATADDLAFWAGLGKREATRAMTIAGPVERVTAPVPRALLLPGYDDYLLGYADRSACIDDGHFERVVPGRNGVFLPMVAIDGRIRATWSRRSSGGRVTIVVRPFEPVRGLRAALDGAALAHGAFLGERAAEVIVDA
jgi:hypothetical protein